MCWIIEIKRIKSLDSINTLANGKTKCTIRNLSESSAAETSCRKMYSHQLQQSPFLERSAKVIDEDKIQSFLWLCAKDDMPKGS